MANDTFRFKRFTIRQNHCAMKVGTDGVILGAWTSLPQEGLALDIGTGTGLLSLMIAQREPSLYVDAIEIDEDAARQANENTRGSTFHDRITISNCDFNVFYRTTGKRYDLVICNPPYFNNSLKPGEKKRALARHADHLSYEVLLIGISELLKPDGIFSLIIPADLKEAFLEKAGSFGLRPSRMLDIFPVPGKPSKRVCLELSFISTEMITPQSIIIEEGGRHQYSKEYIDLTKDFYLAF